ncbi:MAG TPA: VOC family protein [Caulobacteraceae bacterium]|nr:VOC family protein [Caulobacteraceae bacterium]
MTDFRPDGWPRLIPRLFAEDAAGLVGFLREVFGAEGESADSRPSELRIGDSMLLVSEGGGVRQAGPAFLYIYVPDADRTWRAAVDAGATSLEAPVDMPYGDRRAMVRDPFGNTWQIATRKPASGPQPEVSC